MPPKQPLRVVQWGNGNAGVHAFRGIIELRGDRAGTAGIKQMIKLAESVWQPERVSAARPDSPGKRRGH
jgi:hypothetical protein